MRKVRLRKEGISLVALVITIIVLIILTGVVVITGISVPKKAQLTVFYNNVATVQDAVSLQIMNNMMKKATDGSTSKWEGVAEIEETTGEVEFTEMIEELEEVELARISRELLDKTTLADEEKDKYYIDNKGTVYYEGFEYERDTYYNQNTKVEGTALPRVRITADTGVVTNATSIIYTIRFSKSVSGFTKGDITIDGETNTIEITGSGAEYTLVVPTREEDYTQIVRVEANVCQDAEGNGNREGSKTITIDRAKPVVTNETSTTAYTITIKATDGAGIIGYAVTSTNAQPTEFESCTSTTALTQEVTGKTPSTTYYVWVKDISGNVSLGKEVTTAQQPITRADIVAHPELYYGDYVNYKKENGDLFKSEEYTFGTTVYREHDLQWRIFHADEEHIYLTTSTVTTRSATRNWESKEAAIADLKNKNKITYVNARYAEWAMDGITYEKFRDSYNIIVGENVHHYQGDEETGYRMDYYGEVLPLSETLQADLYLLRYNYCLASKTVNSIGDLLVVRNYASNKRINDGIYNRNGDDITKDWGIRPLVCLKPEVQLVKNGNAYDIDLIPTQQ